MFSDKQNNYTASNNRSDNGKLKGVGADAIFLFEEWSVPLWKGNAKLDQDYSKYVVTTEIVSVRADGVPEDRVVCVNMSSLIQEGTEITSVYSGDDV